MKVMESQFLTKEKPPKCCSYCDEGKSFLMVKPAAFSFKGQMSVNFNNTDRQL